MRQLDYGRDNRLRLWFLGVTDCEALDARISPRAEEFMTTMERCFVLWKKVLKPDGICVLVVGNEASRTGRDDLPGMISRLAAKDVGGYVHVCSHTEVIPNERRVRRGITGSISETVLVLRRLANGQGNRYID
jgi:hypothetical protein